MRWPKALLLMLTVLSASGCQRNSARILPDHISVEITHVIAVHEGRYCVIDFAEVRSNDLQAATTEPSTSDVGVSRTYDEWLVASRPLAEFENDLALLRPSPKGSVVLVIPIGEESLADAERAAGRLEANGLSVARQKDAVSPCWQSQ